MSENEKQPLIPPLHFKAIMLRRWILLKRSVLSFVISILMTLIFSALAIVAQYLMNSLMKEKIVPITYKSFLEANDVVAIQSHDIPLVEDKDLADDIIQTLYDQLSDDYGSPIHYEKFATREELQEYVYIVSEQQIEPFTVTFGLSIDSISFETDPMNYRQINATFLSNETGFTESGKLTAEVLYTKALWTTLLGEPFQFSSTTMLGHLMDFIFGMMAPMLIVCGIVSIAPLLVAQPIADINGEVRQFMVSCTLRIAPYWLATFVVDFIVWIGVVTLIWAVFLAAQITAFLDNILLTWYILVVSGPSIILFIYALSFIFSSPSSAARQVFLLMILFMMIPMIIDIVRNELTTPLWLTVLYSLFPHINLMRCLTACMSKIGTLAQPFDYYWTDKASYPLLIMQFANILIWGFVLWLIEARRDSVHKKMAKRSFGDYRDFFKEEAAKHPQSEEAQQMEEHVRNSHDFAVRIEDVSRLFINTAGQPIPAVNCVNLGVKKGSLFGFLGANGAGKTTLIRMITSMLPPSDGNIEINGVDIEDFNDPTQLSICPQFNNHLCDEMTPAEHFQIYSMLFQLDEEEAKSRSEHLIEKMDLLEIKDKPIRELSGGDVRKLAIALSFLGPANIILLDEPTASLDPVARRHVHEMILSYKGEKTFMLCTHLLQEAEFLCDMISIMIKGCLYTCGSPEYLSQKFGTEFKIDVGLTDDSEECEAKCSTFFEKELPEAQLSITRPKARIYNIPAAGITLPSLFSKMEEGKEGDNGFVYYTCSSSSLERVFMEIVRISESDDAAFNMP